jgi:DNA-binding transcriptional LysR family regulator
MTADQLEALVTITQVGGFTEAAQKLGRSQPAISRRIHELEQELGASLFERIGRKATLSAAGKELLPYAEAALASMRDGARAVRGRVDMQTVVALRIAVVGTLADADFVKALRIFRKQFRNASVELQTATSREVSALVRSGEASLGLRYFPDADPRLESISLGTERLHVIVPPSYRIRAARLSNLRLLDHEKWLSFPPDRRQPESFGTVLERELNASGVSNPSIVAVDSLTAQKRLVQAGLGVALMPMSSVREELRIGNLRAIEVASLKAGLPVVLIRRKRGYQSPLWTEFVKVLERSFTSISAR